MKTTSDFERGFNERMAGHYDKWYRYNHKDSGAQYDAGVLAALKMSKCPAECVIIECGRN